MEEVSFCYFMIGGKSVFVNGNVYNCFLVPVDT